MAVKTSKTTGFVKIGSTSGHTVINKNSPLQRLHFFDGKFLRAPDLILEQQALLNQVRISNQAGGAGVVHGYDCTQGNKDDLQINGGLAIDFNGKVLLLDNDINVDIQELIDKSRSDVSAGLQLDLSALKVTPLRTFSEVTKDFSDCENSNPENDINATDNNGLYLITINHTEAYCGQEDVYGKLCSEACSTSTDRSYIIEGIEVRAIPLSLSGLKKSTAININQTHLRSRVAAAFFAQEQSRIGSHISTQGLTSNMWCLGAQALLGNGVPIAVLGRNANATLFLDVWTARRERMDSPPRHYWPGRMAMRSWAVYLAQILQFQCHLRACLTSQNPDTPTEVDPCAGTRKVASEAALSMRFLIDSLGETAEKIAALTDATENTRVLPGFDGGFTRLEAQYQRLIDVSRVVIPNRLMINCGIVEVPSAGYLPVNVSSTITVNEQVQRLFGEGVDLRFCIVRPDFVPHALEEAQHMERICLLTGIDDPAQKAKVDILVPDGTIEQETIKSKGSAYQANFKINSQAFTIAWPRKKAQFSEFSAAEATFDGQLTDTIDTSAFARTNSAVRFAASVPTKSYSVSGAARGEQFDAGGYSFYMAAKSGEKAAVANVTLSSAALASASVLRAFNGQPEIANTSAIRNVNADRAVASDLQVSTLVPTTSVWVELKSERDPFDLNVGDATDVRAKLTLVSTRKSGDVNNIIIEERSISGQLHIQTSATQQTDTKLSARLIADGIWEESVIAGSKVQERTEAIKLDETVIVSRTGITGLPPTISIAIVNPSFFSGLDNIQMVFERAWTSATKSRVRLLLRYQRPARDFASNDFTGVTVSETLVRDVNSRSFGGSQESIIAEGFLQEDQAILQPGNSFHSTSLSALHHIAKTIDKSGFADQAGQLLFPPLLPVSTELRILANASWVLFHRRRDKICQPVVADEILVKPRSYRVYHVHLQNQIEIDKLTQALGTNASDVIAQFRPTSVTIIDYSPGLGSISTNHTDVRADWQAAVRGDADVHIGLIASAGDVINDGEALADVRLHSLTHLLAPVSEVADDLSLLSINEVPPTLAAGEVDGVIIYFTKAVATVCHSVYRLVYDNPETFIGRLDVILQSQSDQSLSSFVQAFGGELLSTDPRFIEGSATFFGTDEAQKLATSWDVIGDGPVTNAVSLSANEEPAQQFITRQQSGKISQVVGTPIPTDSIHYRSASANIFGTCPKASILISESECNDVYFFTIPEFTFGDHIPTHSNDDIRTFLITTIRDTGMTADTLNSDTSVLTHFRPVDFFKDTSQFVPKSREQFQLEWQSELQSSSASSINGFFIVVARAGTDQETADNLTLAQEQGEKLEALMGINSTSVDVVTNNPEVDFPVACRTFTLMVVPTPVNQNFTTANTFAVAVATGTAGANTGDDSTDTGSASALTLDLARAIRFDENNEVIRDEQLTQAMENVAATETKIKTLELVSIEKTADAASESRAKALLKILKEENLANNNAKIVIREADSAESAEIIRSGFLLNRAFVLR